MPESVHYYRARWVFPMDAPPVHNGVVSVRAGKVIACEPASSFKSITKSQVSDLGDVALLPGLCNAHTHLEFSSLKEPIGYRGIDFVDWVQLVIQSRRQSDPNSSVDAELSILRGLEESLQSGTTLLGEIAQQNWPVELRQFPVDVIPFQELIAPTRARAQSVQPLIDATTSLCATTPGEPSGLSPHAPYTVLPEVVEAIVRQSAQHKFPVAMHLAESQAELELIRAQSGKFRELLEQIGAWEVASRSQVSTVLDYLKILSHADRALVVHGNYLNDQEVEFLAQNRQTMSVVWCPRTHDFFGHPRYPVAKLLEAGVLLAIGTDSRASNPDLSLLNELRWVAGNYAEISPEVIFRLGTRNGATALGDSICYGRLGGGAWANFFTIPVTAQMPKDPFELLVADVSEVTGVWVRGHQVIL